MTISPATLFGLVILTIWFERNQVVFYNFNFDFDVYQIILLIKCQSVEATY
jgi:hypothetical protein